MPTILTKLPGYGIISPYYNPFLAPTNTWQVSYISQEHGIISQVSLEKPSEIEKFEVGQKLRIYPNHACIASNGFGWYLVVDGEKSGDVVIDVWEVQGMVGGVPNSRSFSSTALLQLPLSPLHLIHSLRQNQNRITTHHRPNKRNHGAPPRR